MVKEVSLISTSLNLGRPPYLSRNYGPLFGQGIISSSGQIWAHQKNRFLLLNSTMTRSRFIPTMNNIHVWRLEKQINAMILEVVKQRTEAADEKDLVQMIFEGAKAYGGIDSPSLGITRDRKNAL
ncbi:hypothetical protein CsatA_029258 [Cannabis sativa]